MSTGQITPVVDHLAAPLELPNGQHLANRFMKSALSESLGDRDGGPTDRRERLFARGADGGYGLVVTG
jgi:2,4-dienoyl-CoA reductase-like NADH-dependent reductase (Old Yellow Enzyme family)